MAGLKGQCLCGEVQFQAPMPNAIEICHCKTCQTWGGPLIGADYFQGGVTFSKDTSLKWFASSEWAKRGFCENCGSNLFYRLNDNPEFWVISAGSLELPEGYSVGKEIFIESKPDYYAIGGDHPRLTGAEFFASLQGNNNDK